MSGHRIRPSRPAPPSPKLKDSCDRCSISKVRCTKAKPSCARCDKLGYTCFYSPARRVGRPYRPKGSIPEEKVIEEEHQLKNAQTTTLFIDESVKHYPHLHTSPTPVDVHPDSSPSISPIPHLDTFRPAWPALEAPNGHNSSDPDCVLVALDLIYLLESTAMQLRGSNPIDDILLNATTQAIGATIDRLCTILECACCERAEMGMLVSAICMSVIDIHTVSIAMLGIDYPHEVALSPLTPWASPNVGSANQSANQSRNFSIWGEFAEVAKVILQFIEGYNYDSGMNEMNRFENTSGLSVGILPSLAISLRGRLQQIFIDASWSTGGLDR